MINISRIIQMMMLLIVFTLALLVTLLFIIFSICMETLTQLDKLIRHFELNNLVENNHEN